MSYTAKLEVKCWKEHTCSACQTVYRYLFKRTKTGTGGTEQAAGAAATRAVIHALERETEMRPCPACGYCQPEMVGFRRARGHWWMFWITLAVFAVLVVLGFIPAIADHLILWIALAVAACLVVANLIIALLTPNGSPEKNMELAKDYLEDGTMEVTTVSKEEPEPVADPKGGLFWGVFGAAALALLLIVAAELVRLASGWPLNAAWHPQVAGPGDTPWTHFNKRIETVGGYWRAQNVLVHVLNPQEVGIANAQWAASSHHSDWGDKISVKSGQKRSSRQLWARVNVPPEANLAGKEVSLKIILDVEFPVLRGNNAFENDRDVSEHTTSLRLASPRAGKTYTTLWWVGLVGGGLLLLGLNGLLIARANGLIKLGHPTRTYPVERRGQEPVDVDEAEEAERPPPPRDRTTREGIQE